MKTTNLMSTRGESDVGAGKGPELSVVIPMFNEEENVPHLYRRLTDTLQAHGQTYEIVAVEDGSTDRTFELLRGLHETDAAVRVVRLSRNCGQQMAIWAGLRHARGNVVVLIDADLQRPPEDIPRLVAKLSEGYDIVYGVRTGRIESWLRRMGSRLMGKVLRRSTGISFADAMTTFVALGRRLVEELNMFNDKSKFYSGLFAYLSYGRWAAVPVEHTHRHGGKSKYSTSDLIGLTIQFTTTLTPAPLRFAVYAGAALTMLSVLGLASWCTFNWLQSRAVPHADTALILTAVGLFSGLQLIVAGILGEYIRKINKEVKDQPPYIVREVLER